MYVNTWLLNGGIGAEESDFWNKEGSGRIKS
jgi:hypothetical protein